MKYRHLNQYGLLLLLILLFPACSGNSSANKVDLDELNDFPVLSIQTVNEEKGVMDFVTKPVATHVAESIASWTPG